MVLTGFSLTFFNLLYGQEDNSSSSPQDNLKAQSLGSISSGVKDPREDLYLAKLESKDVRFLNRSQFVRQVAEVALYSSKYRLSVASAPNTVTQEFQLEIFVVNNSNGYKTTAKVLAGDEVIEEHSSVSKKTKKDLLFNFRKTLYLLFLGKDTYIRNSLKLDQLTITSVKKALTPPKPKPRIKYIAPKKSPPRFVKAKVKKEQLKVKKKKRKKRKKKKKKNTRKRISNNVAAPVEEVENDNSGNGSEVETIGLDKNSNDNNSADKGKQEESLFWRIFPRIVIKAGFVIGDPVSGLMPENQGVQTLELAAGVNFDKIGTSLSYHTRSYTRQSLSEVEVSQKITEVRIYQNIIGFDLFVDGKSRVYDQKKKAHFLGITGGIGTMGFSGADVRAIESYGFYAVGPYISILGAAMLELNYTTFSAEPATSLLLNNQYPTLSFRFSVGYPL